jgi:hypothetical protein
MKNAFISMGLLAATAFASSAASAATYYVSDCQSGASSGCVAGSDSNTGTSPSTAWKTTAQVMKNFGTMTGGDKILFAKGGAWSNASMTAIQSLKSSASNPITFDSYTPSSGATARPILSESRSGYSMFGFDDGASPEADAGYVVQNLELRGNGVADRGIFTSQLVSDVTLNNLVIDGFKYGMQCGTGILRVKLLNSTLTNNSSQGVLSECADSTIEGNTFDNNGFGSAVFDHSIYINSDYGGAKNVVIRNNTITRNTMIGGTCQSVALVAHGLIDGITIENNKIIQGAGTSTNGCWGIAVDPGYDTAESFKRVIIRGNTVVNLGGVGIGCASCEAPLIENNVIVADAGPEMVGIAVPDRNRGSGDGYDSGAIVRNNSLYFAKAPSSSVGIQLATVNGATAGSSVKVVSNLIYFASGSASTHYCFNTNGTPLANFTAFDNNLCYHQAGNGSYSTSYSTLAAAKSAGFDKNGLSSDPLLSAVPTSSNNWSMRLTAGSPAINAGHSTLSSTVDRLLSLTRSVADIGAYEYTAAGADVTPPASPTSVIVQ